MGTLSDSIERLTQLNHILFKSDLDDVECEINGVIDELESIKKILSDVRVDMEETERRSVAAVMNIDSV